MATDTAQQRGHTGRPMRADARRNYERLLAEARIVFTQHGAEAPLEDIARRAGVGIGTLYRHFPNRTALMGAVFYGEMDALMARSRELATSPTPCRALVDWLRAVIEHASTYRGLSVAFLSAAAEENTELSRCSEPMHEAGSALLARAQQAGAVRPDVEIADLMQLTTAIALAVERSPDDLELADRLLALTFTGLKAR